MDVTEMEVGARVRLGVRMSVWGQGDRVMPVWQWLQICGMFRDAGMGMGNDRDCRIARMHQVWCIQGWTQLQKAWL